MLTSSVVKYNEPLKVDGSNYDFWSAHVLNALRTTSPHAEQILVGGIFPLVDENPKEEEKWLQLNARVATFLLSALSEDILNRIKSHIKLLEDAQILWRTLKISCILGKSDEHDESSDDSLEESEDECSTPHETHVTSSRKKSSKRDESSLSLGKSVRPTPMSARPMSVFYRHAYIGIP